MKKKIFGIFTFIVMLLSCITLSACGDKYEKFEYKIMYALSADAKDWNVVGDDGVLLNYGSSEDELVFVDGKATVYFKVEIVNVKAKYVDDIIVSREAGASSENLNFNSTVVKQNKVFPVEVWGGVRTSLKFYETNSGKEKKIALNIYESLQSINVNPEANLPAVFKGSELNLVTLHNNDFLKYSPSSTNQKGVIYSVSEAGAQVSENGILTIDKDFTKNVVAVSAVSRYNPDIFTTFNVAVLNTQEEKVKATFNLTDKDVEEAYIYPNNARFATTEIKIGNPSDNYFLNGTVIDGVQYKYSLMAYVDGIPYILDTEDPNYVDISQGINGLMIKLNGNVATINAINAEVDANTVKFVWVIKGMDMPEYSSIYSNLVKEVKVNRRTLPTDIRINGEKIVSGLNSEKNIYSTASKSYFGLKLNLSAVSLDSNSSAKIVIKANGLILKDAEGAVIAPESNGLFVVNNGSDVYFNFDGKQASAGVIEFKVRNVPEAFEGVIVPEEYTKTVKLDVKKLTTANSFELLNANNEKLENNSLLISGDKQNNTTYFNLKVNHEKGTLSSSTITLKSNNENVEFVNGQQEIVLNNILVNADTSKALSDGYTIFEVGLVASKANETATITAIAGDESVGVSTFLDVQSVPVVQSLQEVSIVSEDENYCQDVTNLISNKSADTTKYFAIIQNKLVDFKVLLNGSSAAIKEVALVTNAEKNYNEGLSNNNLSYDVTSSSEFSVRGSNNKTQILDLTISYYVYKNGVVEVKDEVVELRLATGSSIASVYASPNKSEIAYINEKYKDVRNVEISFFCLDASRYSPSETLDFGSDNVINNVSGVELSVDNLDLAEFNKYLKVSLNLDGNVTTLSNEALRSGLVLQNNGKNVLEGKIIVELTGKVNEIGINEIKVNFTPKFFEENLTPINVNIENNSDFEMSSGVAISGVSTINNVTEITRSFLDVPNGGYIDVEFGAKATYKNPNAVHYNDLSVLVYEIELDDNGEIVKNGDAFVETLVNGRFEVTVENDMVKLKAYKNHGGGYFRIQVVANDSYNDETKVYTKEANVYLRLTDGTKKNKYVLYTEEDIYNINKNLEAHYVLGANIVVDGVNGVHTPIGGESSFKGSLNGTKQSIVGDNKTVINTRYTITLNVNSYASVTSSTSPIVAGLFARLDSSAEVRDINIKATFNLENFVYTNENGGVHVGAVAGENAGIIRNVEVTLEGTTTIGGAITAGTVNFGGVVGVNNGKILFEDSEIKTKNTFKLELNSKQAHNIGVVTGLNAGEITGLYETKYDLDDISFSVVADMLVVNNCDDEEKQADNVGAIVGENTTKGKINGVVVGGQVVFNAGKTTQSDGQEVLVKTKGYLAGIAGLNAGEIKTNCVIGLNLSSNAEDVSVAGAVGENKATLEDVRVLAVNVKFGDVSRSGKISGAGVVAGAVAENSADISWIDVESFIEFEKTEEGAQKTTFYMLESATNKVAGLVFNNTATVSCSFVKANIANVNDEDTNVYLTTNGTEKNTYFIGKVGKYNTTNNHFTYAVIVSADETGVNTGAEVLPTDFTGAEVLPTDFTGVWRIDNDDANIEYNYVEVGGDKTAYPYLVKDGDMFMIARPTALEIPLNETYIVSIDSIYVQPFSLTDYNVVETVIVNYKDLAGQDAEGENAHKIEDLVTKTIIPNNAQGGIRYEIIKGSNFAKIVKVDGEYKIVFMGVSRSFNKDTNKMEPTPIVVRCYSVFNEEIDKYIVFFTEFGVTDIELTSNKFTEREDEQVISTFVGGSAVQIEILAKNEKESAVLSTGLTNATIFDSVNAHEFLELKVEELGDNDILDIDYSDALGSGVKFTVKEGAEIKEFKEVTLEFTLSMNPSLYSSYFTTTEKVLVTKTIKVVVYEAATDLNIVVGGDTGIYQTDANIGFEIDVLTSYIEKEEGIVNNIEKVGKYIRLIEQDKEYIEIELNAISGESELIRLCTLNNCDLAELFDVSATYKVITSNGKKVGYKYKVNLSLINNRNIRYINEEFSLNVVFMAHSNTDVRDVVNVTFVPSQISTIRIENYSAETVNAYTHYTDLITKSYAETSIITPGGYGGIMALYIAPEYAHIQSATLTSGSLYVPSLNEDVYISFRQLVYNEKTNAYETIWPLNTPVYDDENSSNKRQVGIGLELVSRKDTNGNSYYDGVIYVHTQLQKFSGLEESIEVKLTVNDGVIEHTRTKSLLTTYVPGAVLSYSGAKLSDGTMFNLSPVGEGNNKGYLIQNLTYDNIVDIKTYGYQYNQDPAINFEWWLNTEDETSKYVYKYQEITVDSAETFKNYPELYIKENINGEDRYKLVSEYSSSATTYYMIVDKTTIYERNDSDYSNPISIDEFVGFDRLTRYQDVVMGSDGSYTIQIRVLIFKEMIANFKMVTSLTISNEYEKELTSTSELNFYPINYILRDIDISEIAENGAIDIPMNSSKTLTFTFDTVSENYDLSNEIYKILLSNLGLGYDKTQSGYVDFNATTGAKLKELFTYGDKNFEDDNSTFFTVNFEQIEKDGKITNRLLRILGRGTFSGEVEFGIEYSYKQNENGIYELEFNTSGGGQFYDKITFKLNVYPYTTEETPIPIFTGKEFVENLAEAGNYILMEDIELENFTPINTAIASLDGNNKIIKIKSFNIEDNVTNYGLFASLGEYKDKDGQTQQSILKNVVVDYSELQSELNFKTINPTGKETAPRFEEILFGGLVAENAGLIYNCDVINLGLQTKSINFVTDDNSKITFGGLVAVNDGIITNSRVGRLEFTKVKYNAGIISESKIIASPISFVLGEATSEASNGFSVSAGAFVSENNGIIASSYVSNTSVISHAALVGVLESQLAGFVAINSGDISYSYVRASDKNLTATSVFNTGARIESTKDARVAGFVYTNSDGTISNCFANIELRTTSNFMAGFVDENAGTISECYAAVTMNHTSGSADIAERPFVGTSNTLQVQNSGTLENVYYVMENENSYTEGELAVGITDEGMRVADNLVGFVFVLSNYEEERNNGVWSYYSATGKRVVLPELVGANQVAYSVRYAPNIEFVNGEYSYDYVAGYEPGKKINPYIIRSATEYNKVFTPKGMGTAEVSESVSGYARFINNISFRENDKNIAVQTRSYYVLGDSRNVTSIDGNGMSITNIYLDPEDSENAKSVGLFAEIKNAYVKNLNLSFVTDNTSTNTSGIVSVGGLAGRINDSAIINVTLTGEGGLTLQGQNFVGGLAGIIEGRSMVQGITSDLNVLVGLSQTNLIYGSVDNNGNKYADEYYSYAGGIAGVLDLEPFGQIKHNVAYIDVIGGASTLGNYNIRADYSGGVAGYANNKVSTFYAKYYVGSSTKIYGRNAAGGLYGVNMGNITASQVSAMPEESTQNGYDSNIASYIIALESGNPAILNETQIGNTSLIESFGYGGGLVGINVGSTITASYAKASFASGDVVGGLVGASVQSSITYSYAVPYINYTTTKEGNTKYKYSTIGGLIGKAWENNKSQETLDKLYDNSVEAKTNIEDVFSTIILNRTRWNEDTENENIYLDYLCGNYNTENGAFVCSKGGIALSNVYVGTVDYRISTINRASDYTKGVELENLLNLKNASVQQNKFDTIFSSWAHVTYWDLDNNYFYPLLREQEPVNYIEIKTADDFHKIENNPTRNFMVMQDINMATWNNNNGSSSNYVIPVKFEGVLLGKTQDDNSIPKIFGLKLTPGEGGKTAGFFQATENAQIINLDFEWEEQSTGGATGTAVDLRTDITVFGGVSPNDSGSVFNNLTVTTKNNGNFLYDIDNTVAGFGGIVGYAENSSILGCEFGGKVTATILTKGGDNGVGNFGGLVAKIEAVQKTDDLDPYKNIESATISNCSVLPSSAFNLTLSGGEQGRLLDKKYPINVGVAIGSATDTAISDVSFNLTAEQSLNITIKRPTEYVVEESQTYAPTINIGGVIGFITNSSATMLVESVTSNLKMKVASDGLGNGNGTDSISGFVGKAVNAVTINDVYASTNLDLTEYSAETSYLSLGVAHIDQTSSKAEIKQCLFNGEINSEGSGNNITNVTAGGAVGYSTGIVDLQEVMANATLIVGSSATTNLTVGGLVGASTDTLNVTACVASGRIVPLSGQSSVETTAGGLAGNVNNVNTVDRVYTLVSIITDGLKFRPKSDNLSDNLDKYNVNAAFGKVGNYNVDSEDSPYYSSDFALTADANNKGTNLAASTMLNSVKTWSSSFLSGGSNALFTDLGDNKLPYITSLRAKMETAGILQDSAYVSGTPFNPDSGLRHNDAFTYYMASGNELSFEGVLNGVLIGRKDEYTSISLSNIGSENYYGAIAEVAKHSAVSNVHVRLNKDTSIACQGSSTGLIVGLNNGVVFNSSVMGHNIKLTGGTDVVGLVVGVNSSSGVVDSCFSTAEVTEITTDIDHIGGIVGQDQGGYIKSSYFTGYLNNVKDETIAGGIVGKAASSTYIYNSYMAGTVANVNNARNNFYGEGSFDGYNNFIDNQMGLISAGSNDNLIKDYTTINLMANKYIDGSASNNNKLLIGDWNNQVTLVDPETDSRYPVGKTCKFAGYNYGYPTRTFNKMYAVGSGSPEPQDDIYNEYTGNGSYSGLAGEDERYSSLISNKGSYYEQAFKIPHIGVLNAIRYFAGNNYNFVLIYDIDGKVTDTYNLKWNAIEDFSGVFISNKYLEQDLTDARIATISNLNNQGLFAGLNDAYIADLTFSGKFHLINSGVIGADIVDADKTSVSGTTTVYNVTFAVDTFVYTGTYNDDDEFKTTDETGNNDEDFVDEDKGKLVGGLFGTISANTNVLEVNTNNLYIFGSGATGGTIAGKMTGGTLTIAHKDNSGDVTFTNGLKVYNNGLTANLGYNDVTTIYNLKLAGSIVGEMTNGTIVGSEPETETAEPEPTEPAPATVATESTENLTEIISIYLKYVYAESFGGVVGKVTGSVEIGNVAIITTNKEDEINDDYKGAEINASNLYDAENVITVMPNNIGGSDYNYFGLVAGSIDGGSLKVNNFIVKSNTVFVFQNNANIGFDNFIYNDDLENKGIGGFVGKQNGNLDVNVHVESTTSTADNYKNFNPILHSVGIPNLGGVAGYYAGGTVAVSTNSTSVGSGTALNNNGTSSLTGFSLRGTTNVGGVFGVCAGDLFTADYVQATNKEGDQPNDWENGRTNYFKQNADGSYERVGSSDEYDNGTIYYKLTGTYSSIEKGFAKDNLNINDTRNYINLFETRIAEVQVAGVTNSDNNGPASLKEGDANNKRAQNFGGLFGKLNGNIANVEVEKVTNSSGETYSFVDVGTYSKKSNTSDVKYEYNPAYIHNANKLTILQTVEGKEDFANTSAFNIGGIAGEFNGTDISNVSNGANIELSNVFKSVVGSTTIDYVDFRESVKTINVGGIIGFATGSKNIINVRNNNGDLNTQMKISGYQNVGGYIGYYKGGYNLAEDKGNGSPRTFTTSAGNKMAVLGVVNVGGVVGATVETSYYGFVVGTTASDLYGMDVYGNTNVGAFTGISIKSKIHGYSFYQVNVRAIYELIEKTDGVKSVIPTSVGGLVGKAEDSLILGNNLHEVSITSTSEGAIYFGNANSNNALRFSSIGTVSNEMHYVTNASGNQVTASADYQNVIGTSTVKFADIKTGMSAFVGSMDHKTQANDFKDSGYGTRIVNNGLYGVDVNVPIGVNVGTFYGYIESESVLYNAVNMLIVTPRLNQWFYKEADGTYEDKDIFVDGAYNVGGVAGFVDYASDVQEPYFWNRKIVYTPGMNSIDGGATAAKGYARKDTETIYLQTRQIGIGVGGLFGKLSSVWTDGTDGYFLSINLKNINSNADDDVTVNIILDDEKSYNVGGLVGEWNILTSAQLIGEVTTTVTSQGLTSQGVTKNAVSTNGTNNAEFGAYVGKLKVSEGTIGAGSTIEVWHASNDTEQFKHYYPFTVNTIENSNYTEGKAQFNNATSQGANSKTYIGTQANYVNKDIFEIDSSGTGFTCNPLLGSSASSGWDKQYTGFRRMQRCIAQPDVSTGDSIAVLYDAANILEISKYDSDSDTTLDKVAYIIYETAPGIATLYARNGIATCFYGNGYEDLVKVEKKADSLASHGGSYCGLNAVTGFQESIINDGILKYRYPNQADGYNYGNISNSAQIMYYFLTLSAGPLQGEDDKGYLSVDDYIKNVFLIDAYYGSEVDSVDLFNLNTKFTRLQTYLDVVENSLNYGYYTTADILNEQLLNNIKNSMIQASSGDSWASNNYYNNAVSGLFGTIYTRELTYTLTNDVPKLNSTFDSMDKDGYFFYSLTRPSDYYSKYWIDVGNNGFECYPYGSTGYTTKTYKYSNGAYYIHPACQQEFHHVYYLRPDGYTDAQVYYSSTNGYYVYDTNGTFTIKDVNFVYVKENINETVNYNYAGTTDNNLKEGCDYITGSVYYSTTPSSYYTETKTGFVAESGPVAHWVFEKKESTTGDITVEINGETYVRTSESGSGVTTDLKNVRDTPDSVVLNIYYSDNDEGLDAAQTDQKYVHYKYVPNYNGFVVTQKDVNYKVYSGKNIDWKDNNGNVVIKDRDQNGNELWIDSDYKVSDGTVVGVNGTIPKDMLYYTTYSPYVSDPLEYNINKYLSNSDYNVYTRYMYYTDTSSNGGTASTLKDDSYTNLLTDSGAGNEVIGYFIDEDYEDEFYKFKIYYTVYEDEGKYIWGLEPIPLNEKYNDYREDSVQGCIKLGNADPDRDTEIWANSTDVYASQAVIHALLGHEVNSEGYCPLCGNKEENYGNPIYIDVDKISPFDFNSKFTTNETGTDDDELKGVSSRKINGKYYLYDNAVIIPQGSTEKPNPGYRTYLVESVVTNFGGNIKVS